MYVLNALLFPVAQVQLWANFDCLFFKNKQKTNKKPTKYSLLPPRPPNTTMSTYTKETDKETQKKLTTQRLEP